MRHLPHKEQERLTHEQRAYHRLKQRKADKPYYQRYYAIYIIVIILGWVANLLSGITESSKLYAFYYDFLSTSRFGNAASWGLVIISIVLIELFHRLIARSYFKDLVENDLHRRDMTAKLIAMLGIAVFSTLLSFNGGFDLIRLVKQSPAPLIAETMSIADMNAAYSPIVEDVKVDISDFRQTREWKGRLSDKSAKKWEEMKRNKQQLQLEQAAALKNLSQINLQTELRIDSLNQQRQAIFERQIEDRGYGLGFLTILAMLVLYACLWYDEEYQERKALYLEKKYGAMNTPLPSYHQSQPVSLSPPTDSEPPFIPHSTHEQSALMPKTEENESQNSSGQTWTDLSISSVSQVSSKQTTTSETERHTVEHHYMKGGKKHIVYYTMRMVNSRINQYEREIKDAKQRQLGEEVLQNRQNWLTYWQEKKQELLNKIG